MVPDREELGEPRVSNGVSLCTLHHRTLDRDLMGVKPDLEIHVFRDRLEKPKEKECEIITGFDGKNLRVPDEPELQPDRELVGYRWKQAVDS